MNWYRVLTQHDNFGKGDMVLLPGGAREASLEQIGYLKFVAVDTGTPPGPSEPEPEFLALEPGTRDEAVAPKRGRRGKSVEAGSAEDAAVEPVSGDAARGEDGAAD
jgi:hypothetical protein